MAVDSDYGACILFGRWGLDPALDAVRIRALIGAAVESNVEILRRYPGFPRVRESGVRYAFVRGRDRSGGPVADILGLLSSGYGKCDSLVAYDIADAIVRDGVRATVFLRFEGVDPNGQQQFHALTHVLSGRYAGRMFDPSRDLGMR